MLGYAVNVMLRLQTGRRIKYIIFKVGGHLAYVSGATHYDTGGNFKECEVCILRSAQTVLVLEEGKNLGSGNDSLRS